MKEKKKLSKKALAAKIFLLVSFIPYVIIIAYGIYSAFAGYTFLFSTTYGMQGFLDAVFMMTIFGIVFPILPICLIYQIVYLIVKLVKKRKNKKGENNYKAWDPDFTKVTPEERKRLEIAETEIANGETVSDAEIDWD